jgi:hypothetical protein
MLHIDEHIDERGASVSTFLGVDDGALVLATGDRTALLPMAALFGVMDRYARPLADDVIIDGPSLDLGDGCMLHMIRHRARYDVIARDFLVLVRPGNEPIAELATSIAGALQFLARER